MARPPLFLDDDAVATALDEAADAATRRLARLLPTLDSPAGEPLRQRLREHLAALLTGHPGAATPGPHLPPLILGEDAFGDRFNLEDLPLPRPGTGYAVQILDTDTLLDRASGNFLPVRAPALHALFDSFDAAYAAARAWLRQRHAGTDLPPLAIVPAHYDVEMQRHVLIYGVLTRLP